MGMIALSQFLATLSAAFEHARLESWERFLSRRPLPEYMLNQASPRLGICPAGIPPACLKIDAPERFWCFPGWRTALIVHH